MSKNDDLVRRLNQESRNHLEGIPSARRVVMVLLSEAADAIERGAGIYSGPGEVSFTLSIGRNCTVDMGGMGFDAPLNDAVVTVRSRSHTFTPPAPAPEESSEGSDLDATQEWKLVPVEPTEEMLSAAEASDCAPYALQAWMSMIAAAPSPTPQPPAVEAEPVGYMHKGYTDGNPFWFAKWKNAYYDTPVYSEAALKAKTDEIERLRRERDEWKNSAFLSDCEAHSGQLEEMTIRAEAAEASNKALEKERDHWKADSAAKGQLVSSGVFVKDDEYAALNKELREIKASNKALRERLKPFAKAADECIDDDDVGTNHIWEHPAAMGISIDDLRRARALLSEKEKAR